MKTAYRQALDETYQNSEMSGCIIVPEWLFDTEISNGAKVLYMLLSCYAGGEEKFSG